VRIHSIVIASLDVYIHSIEVGSVEGIHSIELRSPGYVQNIDEGPGSVGIHNDVSEIDECN
jgi:hypothetical protein